MADSRGHGRGAGPGGCRQRPTTMAIACISSVSGAVALCGCCQWIGGGTRMTSGGSAARLRHPGRRSAWIVASGAVVVTLAAVAVVALRPVLSGPPIIEVRDGADALAVTPDGRTLFVASQDSGTVTPVSIPAGIPGTPIKAGPSPQALAVTPDGRTLYVADSGY